MPSMIIKNSTLSPLGDQSRTDASTKVPQKFCINLRLTIKMQRSQIIVFKKSMWLEKKLNLKFVQS